MKIVDWQERPFIAVSEMELYEAIDPEAASKYGKFIKAAQISNRDYQYRYSKLSKKNNMRPPPSAWKHIFLGFIVIRNLGTTKQYETWMSEIIFEDLYKKLENT